MKKVFLLFIAIAMFSACSKDDDNGLPQDNECKVISISTDEEVDIGLALEYDNQGRVVRSNSEFEYSEYTYQANKIIVKEERNGGQSQIEYTLNGAGLITSGTESYEWNGNTYTTSYTFTYNSDGYLKEWEEKTPDYKPNTIEFEYSNGNLIKGAEVGYEEYTNNYLYDTSQPYLPFTSHLISLFGEEYRLQVLYETGYLGKLPKNRVISVDGFNITYETGSDGKVTKVKGGGIEIQVGWKCD